MFLLNKSSFYNNLMNNLKKLLIEIGKIEMKIELVRL